MEDLLAEHSVQPPRSGRLARLADGRPGRALALAAAPEAVAAREELARSILDLVDAPPADRLVAVRELLARAADLARADEAVMDMVAGLGAGAAAAGPPPAPGAGGDDPGPDDRPARGTPAERRLAAAALLAAWAAVARDLAVVVAGCRDEVRDPALLDDLEAVAPRVTAAPIAAFLGRLGRAGSLLEANANPELLLDTLVLAWVHATDAGGGEAR
jgi:hypothetical protein